MDGLVNEQGDPIAGDRDVQIGVLLGDVNGDGAVNILDLGETKNNIFRTFPVPDDKLQFDVTADGRIDLADLEMIKGNLFHQLAACP